MSTIDMKVALGTALVTCYTGLARLYVQAPSAQILGTTRQMHWPWWTSLWPPSQALDRGNGALRLGTISVLAPMLAPSDRAGSGSLSSCPHLVPSLAVLPKKNGGQRARW